jgi:Membrane carboxypeptidase (penicillin-binding protein)
MDKGRLKKIGRYLFVWTRNILLFLFALSLFLVLLYKYVPVYQPVNLLSRKVENLFSKDKVDIKHQWVSLDNISPELIQAAIASEDKLFLIHNGFNFGGEEINPNLPVRNRYDSNGGTISGQTAEAVFLIKNNTYFNRIMQTYFTLLIEFTWGKKRIMEVYLNTVEMGDGIYGAEAMARAYYPRLIKGKTPTHASTLSRDEAAMMAVMITNPREFNPDEPTAYMLRYQAKILSLMDKTITIDF